MKEILSAFKENIVNYLKHKPSENERLLTRQTDRYIIFGFIAIILVAITGYSYIQAQPVSFEGDVTISGGIAGDPVITALMNNSEIIEQFNITGGASSVNGSIHLHGTYQMPMIAFMKISAEYLEYYGV